MLSSSIALVTGAGRGIGKATCITLAKENAKIIALDLNLELTEKVKYSLAGDGHSAFEVDVSNSESINKIVPEIIDCYGKPPSIIVNCAGIIRDNLITNMSEKQFDEVVAVNLKGTYLILQTFAGLLIEHNMKGSIINVGSITGRMGNIGQCNYSASKAGVEALTKTAAKEFGRYDIRCNAVIPGFINTAMTQGIPEKVKSLFRKRIPIDRFGEPEEVAEIIKFLASDSSSYINGASIEVTGGFN